MANVDRPMGFRAIGNMTGGEPHKGNYTVASGQEVPDGHPVKMLNTGEIQAADAGDTLLGMAEDYVGASDTNRNCVVCDDPEGIFRGQCASGVAFALTHCENNADFSAGTAVQSDVGYDPDRANIRKTSGAEVNLATVTAATANLRIIRLAPEVGNEYGEHADVLVTINEHIRKTTTGI